MLKYAPVVRASAKTGMGLSAAMDLVVEAAQWRRFQVPKARLNEVFKRAQAVLLADHLASADALQLHRV